MKKYIIIAIFHILFTPIIFSANLGLTAESSLAKLPSYSEGQNDAANAFSGSSEWSPGSSPMGGNQQALMAPPLPGDIGGEFAPVNDSWLVVFIFSFIYIMVRKFYFRNHQLSRKKN